MRTVHTFYGMTADISEEMVREYNKDISPYFSLARKLEEFAKLDAAYVRSFLDKRGYSGRGNTIRMLEAHGYSDHKKGFLYADLEDEKLVWTPLDRWLDLHEGKYDVLYLSCCNKGNIELPARKSMLIYTLGRHSGEDIIQEVLGNNIAERIRIIEARL